MHAYLNLTMDTSCPPVPLHYNYLIQAALYAALPEGIAGLVHDEGYVVGKRTFKPFTFSRLLGKFVINKSSKTIIFPEEVHLVIASPDKEFFQTLIGRLFMQNHLVLGKSKFFINGVRYEEKIVTEDVAYVRTLSPVVAYSTLLRPEGGKYTCYYQPGESEFTRLITGNLTKKYEAFYGAAGPAGLVQIYPLSRPRLHVTFYKGTVIKGYTCHLKLSGPKELLQMALDAGLGAKGSQGYGCLDKMAGSSISQNSVGR